MRSLDAAARMQYVNENLIYRDTDTLTFYNLFTSYDITKTHITDRATTRERNHWWLRGELDVTDSCEPYQDDHISWS